MRVEPEMTFRTDLGADGDVGDLGELRVGIAGDGSGLGSAGTGIVDGADHIGRAARGRDTHDDVLARGAAAGDVTLAELGRVFVDIGGGGQSLGSASHDVLHLLRCGGKSGRALRGVEGGDAA